MILESVDTAMSEGASLAGACEVVGLSTRTVQRWRQEGGGDDRRRGPTSAPHNKLGEEEDAAVVEIANSPDFAELSPKQIVPRLADRGRYIASESTFYRRLRAQGLLKHRSRARPRTHRPRALTATGPDQVYSWDITYLPTRVTGRFVYLYLVVDVWSRKIIAAEVHERECGELAANMLERTCGPQLRSSRTTWLHSDNGGPMKSAALLSTLRKLKISPSFSRPRTSNDNPYSEALFRTLKYRPCYPSRPFADLEAARTWVARFVTWYNDEHLHSALSFVTPSDRHAGRHLARLAGRAKVYAAARRKHPERWSRSIRRWDPIPTVCLNRFHVMKAMNQAVDEVRRAEHKELLREGDRRLAKTMHMLRYAEKNLPARYAPRLAELKASNLKVARAWALKESLRGLWECESLAKARAFWADWHDWASRSQLAPVVRVAQMIKRHIGGILNYYRHHLTNAIAECTNGVIEAIKRTARGFRNLKNLKTAILFHCGGLKLEKVSLGAG